MNLSHVLTRQPLSLISFGSNFEMYLLNTSSFEKASFAAEYCRALNMHLLGRCSKSHLLQWQSQLLSVEDLESSRFNRVQHVSSIGSDYRRMQHVGRPRLSPEFSFIEF